MGVATAEWLQQENPASWSEADIWAYFGIPPAPASDLDANIKSKRQFWTKRANGPAGREAADKIKQMIQNLSKVLKEGTVPEGIVPTADGRFEILGNPATPQELAQQLEQFLRDLQYAQVLRLAQFGLDAWPGNIDVLIAIDLALSDIFAKVRSEDPQAAGLARQVSDQALHLAPSDPQAWLCKVRILLADGQMAHVVDLEQQASARGIRLNPEVYLNVAAALFQSGDDESAVQRLIFAVNIADGDPGVRSMASDLMIKHRLLQILPLQSAAAARTYVEAVQVAAWLADGVPESEAELIPFRVWATEAVEPVFVGDPTTKSFLGILSGFLALPILSKLMARPGWRVLWDGPFEAETFQQFCYVNDTDLVETLHRSAPRRFPWEQETGGRWPKRDEIAQHLAAVEAQKAK